MEKKKSKDLTAPFNRTLYCLFWFLCLYQVFVQKEYIGGASSLGIALIFDPFNQCTPWNERPKWQRAWLLIHLALAGAVLGFGISRG